jgi:Alginate export
MMTISITAVVVGLSFASQTPTTDPPAAPETPAAEAAAPPPAEVAPQPAPSPVAAPAPESAPIAPATPAVQPTLPGPAVQSPIGAVDLIPRAQVRVRGELVGDRTLGSAPLQNIITHRARLGLSAAAADRVTALLEVQDVRAWGSEVVTNPALPPDPTVFGHVTDALELHQGWVGLLLDGAEIRVGRQEIAVSNERIIGALDWAQRARAFDAVRVLSRGTTDFTWTGFFALVRDAEVAPVNDVILAGASLEWKLVPWLRLTPGLFGDADLTIERTRGTGGARADGSLGGFNYDVELYGQVTSTGPDVTFAGLLGARASYGFDVMFHPRIGLVTDVLTGSTDGQGPIVAFDTLYATNHKFYGFQDLFLNLPLHTQGHGLVDTALAAWVSEGPLSVAGYLHAFLPSAYDGPGTPMYGVEPDLVVTWKPITQLAVELGTSVFVPVGDALGRGSSLAPWGYLQIAGQI